MKEQRNLSGIYYRSFDKAQDKWVNICFEELSETEQDNIINNYTDVRKANLIKLLAETINRIGNELDLYSE